MYQTWLKTFFSVFLTGLLLVVLFNAVEDPMLVLPFTHKLNNRVRFINERQQKTNLLYFSHFYGQQDYDGIILGSSRSSGIRGETFAPQYHVFNYAAAASQPAEAVSYLQFAQDVHGKPLRFIMMGLDFMSSSGVKSKSHTKGIPVVYTQDIKKPFYILANLMNLKAFHLSTRVLRANLHRTKNSYFERSANATVEYEHPSAEQTAYEFNKTMDIYKNIYATYRYNPDYKQVLREIKNAFPQAQFKVFTTPVSVPQLQMLYDAGLLDSYKQWLTDIVDVFGEVTHFMDDNPVTRGYPRYFYDSHHTNQEGLALMSLRLQGKTDGVPDGFGKVLTRENIAPYLEQLPTQ